MDGKQRYIPGGWRCPSDTCDYIIKDFVCLDIDELKKGKGKGLFIKDGQRIPIKYEEREAEE